jgi:hypothetical protein
MPAANPLHTRARKDLEVEIIRLTRLLEVTRAEILDLRQQNEVLEKMLHELQCERTIERLTAK